MDRGKDHLAAGAQAEATLTVTWSDTAAALSPSAQDTFPPVFATSRMVALMELAAARVLQPLLRDGQLSVGTSLTVGHTAATPVGCEVRAVATYLERDGRAFRFRVEAFDAAGPIGAGEHSRAIVATERLLAGAARRRPG
ncbi:MAG: hotdog domain-containing protein [Gammaproteobacteria bacterium]|nr:MAG: hotdog domain-containing protein [Gammaproteobacteria bacterium]